MKMKMKMKIKNTLKPIKTLNSQLNPFYFDFNFR